MGLCDDFSGFPRGRVSSAAAPMQCCRCCWGCMDRARCAALCWSAPENPTASRALTAWHFGTIWALQCMPRALCWCHHAGCGPSIQRAVSWLTWLSRCILVSPYDRAFHSYSWLCHIFPWGQMWLKQSGRREGGQSAFIREKRYLWCNFWDYKHQEQLPPLLDTVCLVW